MQDELLHLQSKLTYSDAQNDLTHIFTILNFHQTFTNELKSENKRLIDNEDSLGNNAIIL